jgi:D-alanyl-lipoteichoic acid acyltransferase DltB (MBOAT superfamily)
MLFHTWTFFIFFAVTIAGFWALRPTRFWLHWILLSSAVFYGWWHPYYLLLVFYSTALDYFIVSWMERGTRLAKPGWRLAASVAVFVGSFAVGLTASEGWGGLAAAVGFFAAVLAVGHWLRSSRAWLGVSIINNLSVLVFFKYAGFAIENLNGVLARIGAGQLPSAESLMPPGWEYVLPVGISFYTFQSMSYTIDFYRGAIAREPSFVRFAAFVTFFPQLVAGPIERAKNLLPQFAKRQRVTLADVSDGASLFLLGLFKKVALANYLGPYVDRVYGDAATQGGAALALATFAFAWQIYFDFSGYTDMARGVARCMGFRLMLNFRNPYLAVSLADFWSRWHISLSTWFRDYVYIPLGGSRVGSIRLWRNLLITFVISGLWHGAAWTFLIWGILHGLGLIANRALEQVAWWRERCPRLAKRLVVFAFVCFAWVFFRAESLGQAVEILQRILTIGWADPQMPLLLLLLVVSVWVYQFVHESPLRGWLEKPPVKVGLAVAMILWMLLFAPGGGEPFIYFQF